LWPWTLQQHIEVDDLTEQKVACCGTIREPVTIKQTLEQTTNSMAFSPQANYTDGATATCWQNLVQTFVHKGVLRGKRGGSHMVVTFSSLDWSRYFSFK
jgi:hypothetical protein